MYRPNRIAGLYLANMLAYTAIADMDSQAKEMGDHEFFIPSKYWNELQRLDAAIEALIEHICPATIEELCYLTDRQHGGRNVPMSASNFLKEIDDLLTWNRLYGTNSRDEDENNNFILRMSQVRDMFMLLRGLAATK